VGQTATFTVTVTGAGSPQFQWRKGGVAISGANQTSYTTPVLAPADNGETFDVVITNASDSLTSATARLTVGPRAPKTGDWRFQGMDLPGGQVLGVTDLQSFQTATFTDALGTPLDVSLVPDCGSATDPTTCGWPIGVFALPQGITGVNTVYESDWLANLGSDVLALAAPSNVITGVDPEMNNGVFALSWIEVSQTAGFVPHGQTIAKADLASVASALGQQGEVITAAWFDESGQLNLLSYKWQGDTTTTYDVVTFTYDASTGSDAVLGDLSNMASQGYILTAIGGDPANGLVLVGTRVSGDSLPRTTNIPDNKNIDQQVQHVEWKIFGQTADVFFEEQ
jgi:hypothetical protein